MIMNKEIKKCLDYLVAFINDLKEEIREVEE